MWDLRGGVKICGVTCVADALACVAAGAEFIGLNFYHRSVRAVTPERAMEIVRALPPSTMPVGVFVDHSPDEVANLAALIGLEIVQLHGHEPPADLKALAHLGLIKAFPLRTAADWSGVVDYLAEAQALGRAPDAVLIDAQVSGQRGGTGVPVAADVLDAIPPLPRLALAGGLTPENVAERIAQVRPWMVDTASGVESSPGCKDPAKIAGFVRAAKNAMRAAASAHQEGWEQ